MLYEDCLKLSRTRVSEQQRRMEMAPNSRAHAFRSNSVPWRLPRSSQSRVSEQQCCMDIKVQCCTLALEAVSAASPEEYKNI